MAMYWYGTCRGCGQMDHHDNLVRYGARHNMHFRCYLESEKPLGKLPRREIGRFPFRLLRDFGKLDEARAAIAKAEGKP